MRYNYYFNNRFYNLYKIEKEIFFKRYLLFLILNIFKNRLNLAFSN